MAQEFDLVYDDVPEVELVFDEAPGIELVFDEAPAPKRPVDLRMGGPGVKEPGWEQRMRERAREAAPEYRKIIVDPLKGFLAKGAEVGTFLVEALTPLEAGAIGPERVGEEVGVALGADIEGVPFKIGKFIGTIAEIGILHKASAGVIDKLKVGEKLARLGKPVGDLIERSMVDFGMGAGLATIEGKEPKEVLIEGAIWATIGGALGLPRAVTTTTKAVRDRAGKWAVEKAVEAPVKEVPEAISIVDALRTKIREAKPQRELQESVKREWRAKQAAAMEEVSATLSGKELVIAKRRILKEKMPRVDFTPLDLSAIEQDAMFNMIRDSKKVPLWNKLPAEEGLLKLFGQHGGTVPTENELTLLREVFGKDFVKAVMGKRSMYEQMAKLGYQVANLPRASMASADMSALLRQAIMVAPRHPSLFLKNFFRMHGFFFSENAFKGAMERITQRPTYKLMVRGKLPLTRTGGALNQAEEAYMIGGWGDKIPWIRMSNRAHTGFLNNLRADVFDKLVSDARKMGRNPETDEVLIEAIGKFVGDVTGRGTLGGAEGMATFLNTFLFSPRLAASRISLLTAPFNPRTYSKLDPFVRKELLKSWAAFLSSGMTVLGLANAAGADVGLDPRSPDFGKIKIGNTRLDVWGGFQQYAVFASRILSGQQVSSTTGRVTTFGEGYKPTTRLTVAGRALRGKLAPSASFIVDWMDQQDAIGESFDVTKATVNRFVPMVINDAKELYEDDPDSMWMYGAPVFGFYGTGIQTYE